jgi:hypothetical protein
MPLLPSELKGFFLIGSAKPLPKAKIGEYPLSIGHKKCPFSLLTA